MFRIRSAKYEYNNYVCVHAQNWVVFYIFSAGKSLRVRGLYDEGDAGKVEDEGVFSMRFFISVAAWMCILKGGIPVSSVGTMHSMHLLLWKIWEQMRMGPFILILRMAQMIVLLNFFRK